MNKGKWFVLGQDHRFAASAQAEALDRRAAGHKCKLQELRNGHWQVLIWEAAK